MQQRSPARRVTPQVTHAETVEVKEEFCMREKLSGSLFWSKTLFTLTWKFKKRF